MPITLDGSAGIGTPGVASTGAVSGTTGTFTGNVTANGLATELRPLVLMTSQASTSGTSIDFTGIPSWAKRVSIGFNQMGISANGYFGLQLGTSGGIETSGYVGANIDHAVGENLAAWSTSALLGLTVANGWVFSGTITAMLMNPSANTWSISGVLGQTSGASARGSYSGGVKTLSGTLTQIRVLAVAGAFNAGIINVMYE